MIPSADTERHRRSRPKTIYNDNMYMYMCWSAGGSTWLCRALSSACGAAARPASASGGGLCRWRAPDISATEEQTREITYSSRWRTVFIYDSQLYTEPMTLSHLRVIVTQTIMQTLPFFIVIQWPCMPLNILGLGITRCLAIRYHHNILPTNR